MYCTQCGHHSDDSDTFCTTCGATLSASPTSPVPTPPHSPSQIPPVAYLYGTIHCANCNYTGQGEGARQTISEILAWLAFFLSPLITIIYYLVTYKWRCPQCKSIFLHVQNKNGQFVQQKHSNIALVIILGLVGIAIIGILASVVLASLSAARDKAQEAASATGGDVSLESEEASLSLLSELNPNMTPLGQVTDRTKFDAGQLSAENWREVVTYNTAPTVPAPAQSRMRFPDQQEVFRAVVKIVCEDGENFYYGSGTNIDGAGYILTNKHVVTDPTPSECLVGFPDPTTGLIAEAYWATPILDDDDNPHDLALLSVEQPVVDEEYNVYGSYERYLNGNFPFYEETDACLAVAPALGDQVFLIGYPYLSGGALTITDGLVSSLYSADGYLVTSGKISSGSSGGLAVDVAGCLVGVPTAVYWEENEENYGEIIDAQFVYDFRAGIKDEVDVYLGSRTSTSKHESDATTLSPVLPSSVAMPRPDDDVVATVNGFVITRDALDTKIAEVAATNDDTGTQDAVFENQVLNEMINLHLLTSRARAQGFIVTEQEVDSEISQLITTLGGQTAFEEQLRIAGISSVTLRTNMQTELLIRKLLDAETAIENVTDEEAATVVQEYINDLRVTADIELFL